jgi:choline dehydrogenase-like flavoprotein
LKDASHPKNPKSPADDRKPLIVGAGHFIGTYRMGTAKSNSVVDLRQRSWDWQNLFLVGSGVFPTSATANPTLTIGALAFWAADTIAQDLAVHGQL